MEGDSQEGGEGGSAASAPSARGLLVQQLPAELVTRAL